MRTGTAMRAETVNVEFMNHAGISAHVSHALARATLRPFVDAVMNLATKAPRRGAPVFLATNRLELFAAVLGPPRGTVRRPVLFPKFRAEWLWHRAIPGPDQPGRGVILYLHGGAFIAGGLHSHRRMAARIAHASGVPLLNVAYRQIPKAHITDTLEDALTAYRYLLDLGFAPERIILAGDSAGAGLTFTTALAARDRGLPVPGGIAAISPWADIDPARRRAHPNKAKEAVLSPFSLSVLARLGFARDGDYDPAWSPANHDYTGLPPVFIQLGSQELLRPDGELIAQRCAEAGVPCTVQIWDKAIHDFQAISDLLPDARAALRELATFNRGILDRPVPVLRPTRTG